MEFGIKNLWRVEIGGMEFWITETIRNTWIIMAALILFAIIARVALRKFEDIPQGFQNFLEMGVQVFDDLVKSAAGENFMKLGNWFFMVFLFVLTANISGLVGLRPATADWATTFALALATFFMIQKYALAKHGLSYFKGFLDPHPVFLPLNIIGELARPISLSFRLFGNILAGMILMALIYELLPIFITLVLPVPLHAFFDLFSGALQAYIFCVLSMTFIGAAAAEDGA